MGLLRHSDYFAPDGLLLYLLRIWRLLADMFGLLHTRHLLMYSTLLARTRHPHNPRQETTSGILLQPA